MTFSKAEHVKNKASSSSLGSVFDELLEESEIETGSVNASSAVVQLQSYLSAQSISHKVTQSATVPEAKLLCTLCTRVDGERLFSVVSNTRRK